MSEEIKEIIKLNCEEEIDVKYFAKDDSLVYTTMDYSQLLDYITNLQERKITKEDVDKYFEENMCVSFEKFIENWKEQEEWTNYYMEENERLNNQYDLMENSLDEKQEIIDKAIEYIQNNKLYTFKYDDEEMFEITTDKIAKDNLLKILGGDE